MRFERVVAEGFGPLVGETLEFAEGMTVVFGPNESAKTTLHAATYAALCGMRRGRGQPRVEDRLFAARHRPWNGDTWRVQAQIRLEDGRVIELWHDLDGKVDCRAMDVSLGRDVSNEIMFDGAPDGSKWLGFDRVSFVATACVRQSAIAAVLDNADALQDEIQRAAASAGRDETAGEAIARLKAFSSEQVGLNRSNSTKPLRSAIVRLERAERSLEATQDRHAEYLEALERVAERESARDGRRRELRLAEAAVARAAAARALEVAERAAELAQKYPQEPSGVSGDQRLADEVAEALAMWDGCPAEPDLSGETTEELEGALAALPERPEGDLAPTQDVLDADSALRFAGEALTRHLQAEVPATDLVALPADPAELEALASVLERDAPEVNEELRSRVATLRARIGGEERTRSSLPLVAGGILLVVGVAAAAVVSVAAGAALAFIGLALAAGGLWFRRQRPDLAAAEALATAEQMLGAQEEAAEVSRAVRAEALGKLQVFGLAPESTSIRELITRSRSSAAVAKQRAAWDAECSRLTVSRDAARAGLEAALEARGVPVAGDLAEAVSHYKMGCAERAEQERAAARRPRLEQQLATRRAAEAAAAARAAARGRLLAVVPRVGSSTDDAGTAAAELRAWQEGRQRELGQHDRATAEWSRLQELLDGRTVESVRNEAAEKHSRAEELAGVFLPEELAAVDGAEAAARLDDLRAAVEESQRLASTARGQVEEMASSVPSVPEAEERLAAAEAELERVRELDDILAKAIVFLEAAQDRVHRSIAPVIQETLRTWLPRVVLSRSGGALAERYDDVVVDPESLAVKVRLGSGPWYQAELLSEGTKEQIFLLLRVALAEHLTKEGEIAPLIFDEITAQCDAARRVALLQLLHELSGERQVILFTHDDGVLAWAEEAFNVESGRDRIETREAMGAV